jgi:alpha-L-fucosidase 2
MVKAVAQGGRIIPGDRKLHVEKANKVVLWLSAATSFINPKDVSGDPVSTCSRYLKAVADKSYKEVRKAHIIDYRKYYDRFSIYLGASGREDLPTVDRIAGITGSMDNSLAALYVQYGRYLLLSSSREGTYPANLQGIWNDRLNPSWDSKYTVNINTEMNYWPVEVLNIAECHDALFRIVEEVVLQGARLPGIIIMPEVGFYIIIPISGEGLPR